MERLGRSEFTIFICGACGMRQLLSQVSEMKIVCQVKELQKTEYSSKEVFEPFKSCPQNSNFLFKLGEIDVLLVMPKCVGEGRIS